MTTIPRSSILRGAHKPKTRRPDRVAKPAQYWAKRGNGKRNQPVYTNELGKVW